MGHIYSFRFRKVCMYAYVALLVLSSLNTVAQVTGDYRSLVTGNWTANTTWQRYDGVTWVAAAAGQYPGSVAGNPTVTIRNGHTVSITATPVNSIGALNVGEGATGILQFNAANFNLTVTGTTTILNGAILRLTTTTTGTRQFANIVVNAGGSWINSGNSTVRITGNIQNDGTFTDGTGLYTLAGTGATISGVTSPLSIRNVTITGSYTASVDFTVATALSGAGSLTLDVNRTLRLGGSCTITTLDLMTNAPTSVEFNGTANQTIPVHTYDNLIASNGTVGSSKTLAGATTVNGDITINNLATLADGGFVISGTAGNTIYVNSGGAYTTTRTVTPWFPTNMSVVLDNNGTVNYNGAATNLVATDIPATYGHLAFGGSGTKTLPASTPFTINGNLTIAAAVTVANNGNNITVMGNLVNNTGTHSGTGYLIMAGTAAQAITSTVTGTSTFGNMQFSNSNVGGVTFSNTATTTGISNLSAFNVVSGLVNIGGFTSSFNVSGASTIAGTINFTSATGTKNFGDLTINTTGTLNNTINEALTITGNIVNDGTMNANTATHTLAGSIAYTISGAAPVVIPNASITNTVGYTNLGTFVVTTLSGAGKFTAGTNSVLELGQTGSGAVFSVITADLTTNVPNTVLYSSNNGTAQTVRNTTYSNLTINKPAGQTANLAGTIVVNGNLNIISGILRDNNAAYLVTGPGTSSGTFSIGPLGNFTMISTNLNPFPLFQTYAFDAASTVVYSGAIANQNIYTVPAPGYGHLSLSGGTRNATGSFTVQGNLSFSTALSDNGNVIRVLGDMTVTNTSHLSTGTGKILMQGTVAQNIIASTQATFGNLEIDNAAGVTLNSTVANTVTGNLILTAGNLNVANAILNLNGPAVTDNAGALQTTAGSTLAFGPNTNNNTGLFVPSSVADLKALTINVLGGNAVTLNSDVTVSGGANALSITSGNLVLGANDLTLTATTTIAGTWTVNNMIIADGAGELKKTFPAGANTDFVYPVGDATGTIDYAPLRFDDLNPVAVNRNIGVRLVDAVHPDMNANGTQTHFVSRYWKLTDDLAGSGTYTYAKITLNYSTNAPSDENGVNTNYKVNRWDGTSWSQLTSTFTASNVVASSVTYNQVNGQLGGNDFTIRDNPNRVYTWLDTNSSADWTNPLSWTPARYTPYPTDILQFNLGGTTIATNIPTETVGQIIIANNTDVTWVSNAAAAQTVTIGGLAVNTGNNLSIATGSTLQLSNNAANIFRVQFAAGTQTASIYGKLVLNASAAVTSNTFASTNAVVTVYGELVNAGGTVTSATNNLFFANGAVYTHSASVAAAIPTATWDVTSNCKITGLTATALSGFTGQTFGNFTYDCTSQSAALSLGNSTATVQGNFTVNNTGIGSLVIGTAANTLNVFGDFIVNDGTVNLNTGAVVTTLNLYGNYLQLNGAVTQTGAANSIINFRGQNKGFTQTGGTLTTTNMSFVVFLGASLNLNSNLTVAASRTFTVNGRLNCENSIISGGGAFTVTNAITDTLAIGSVDGITTAGATGNIQTTTRTYNILANYIYYKAYTGSAVQNTGNGLPATVNSLTIDNTNGVVLNNTGTTVSSMFNLNSGIFSLGNNNITLSATATLGGNVPGAANMVAADATGGATGQLIKVLPAGASSFTFPVGDNTGTAEYSPVTLNFTANSISGSVGVRVVNNTPPAPAVANYLNRYWMFSTPAVLGTYTYSATYSYLPADVVGTTSSMLPSRYDGANWIQLPGNVAGNQITFSGTLNNVVAPLAATSYFTGREGTVNYYRSVTDGDWNTVATWEVDDNPGFSSPTPASVAPTSVNSASVLVSAGDKVTASTAVTAVDLVVDGILETTASGAVTATGSISFTTGSTYEHNRDGGAIPVATWSATSTCIIKGLTATTVTGFAGQTFGNFIYDCIAQNTATNHSLGLTGTNTTIQGDFTVSSTGAGSGAVVLGTVAATININGNLIISGGVFNLNTAALATTVNLGGNYQQTGGTFTQTGAANSVINFLGVNKTFTQSAGTMTTTNMSFTVATGAFLTLNSGIVVATGRTFLVNGTLYCGINVVSGAGTFTLANSNLATLGIGDVNGITPAASGTGVTAGNIRTTARTFNISANLVYNGTTPQVTGTGLATTWGSTIAPTTITINNAAGVTLSQALTVNNFSGSGIVIQNGVFNLGANNLTIPVLGDITTPSSFSATNMIAASGAGQLIRSVPTGASTVLYPIGDVTGTAEYSPASLNFISNAVAGTVGLRVVNAAPPAPAVANYLNRHWIFTIGSLTTYTYTPSFTYVPADVTGSEAAMVPSRYNGTTWIQLAGSVAGNIIQFTGTLNNVTAPLAATSYFTGREGVVNYYRSVASGDWNTLTTWEMDDNPSFSSPATPAAAPTNTNSARVEIRTGDVVTASTAVTAVDVVVDGTLQTTLAGALTSNGTVSFNAGSTYEHNRNGGVIPTATWNTASTCRITGLTSTTLTGFTGQSFGNFVYDCTAQTTATALSLGLTGTATTIKGNFTVSSTGAGTGSVVLGTVAATLNINGDLILSGGVFNLNTAAVITTVNLSGNYNQTGGTFTQTGAANSIINFLGNNKTYTQSGGTITTTNMSFAVATGAFLTLNNNLVVSASRSFTVNGTLYLGSNIISGAGSFILANTSAATLGTGHTQGLSTLASNGSIQTTTRTYNTQANIVYNGSVPQVTGNFASVWGGVNTTITINNAAGVSLTQSLALNNNAGAGLILQNGVLSLGAFDLSIPEQGTITTPGSFSSSVMVRADGNGKLYRGIPTSNFANPYVFPVGSAGAYSPFSINFSSNTVAGLLGVGVVASAHPNIGSVSNYINRYWTFATSGLSGAYTYSATMAYPGADVQGDETLVGASLWNGSSWVGYTSVTNNINHTIDFPIAGVVSQANAPLNGNHLTGRETNILYYYRTKVTGNWANATTWEVSTDQAFINPPATNATQAPTPANSLSILIRNGHTVTVAANASADQLIIEPTGMLTVSTGNTFTLIDGPGTDFTMNGTGATVTVDGTFTCQGTYGGAQATFIVNGTYRHEVDGGIIPDATWHANSTCFVTGMVNATSIGGFNGQNFGNFTYDCTAQSSGANVSLGLAGTTSMQGNFTVASTGAGAGTLLLKTGTTPSTLNVAGDILVTDGNSFFNTAAGLLTLTARDLKVSAGNTNLNSNTGGTTVSIRDLDVSNGILTVTSNTTAATLNIDRDLLLSGGTVNFSSANVATNVNIGRHYNQSNGTLTRTNTASVTTINFTGTACTYTQTGGTVTNTAINYGVNIGAFLTLNSDLVLANSRQFNVNGTLFCTDKVISGGTSTVFALANASTATLGIGSPDGISSALATGNIRTATRTYSAGANYIYNGTVAQNSGVLTAFACYDLVINNAAGVTLESSMTVNDSLELMTGVLRLGNNNITLGAAAGIGGIAPSATNMVAADASAGATGQLIKVFPINSNNYSFTYPIGDNTGAAEYSPATFVYTANNAAAVNIGLRVSDIRHPQDIPVTADYLSRYWIVTYPAALPTTYTLNAAFTYPAADVNGTEAGMQLNRYDVLSNNWVNYTSTVTGGTMSATFTQADAFLLNTTTSPTSFDVTGRNNQPAYYRTVASGNWNNLSLVTPTWEVSTDSNFVSPAGQPATMVPNNVNAAGIFIRSTHTVTVTAAQTADDVKVDGSLVINGGITFTLANGAAPTDMQVNGSVVNSGVLTPTGVLAFGPAATYNHAQNAGIIPLATWHATSTCSITGITTTALTSGFNGQTFGNFVYDCPGQTGTNLSLGLAGTTNIQGDFTVNSTGTAGSIIIKSGTTVSVLNITGDCNLNAGSVFFNNGTGLLTVTARDINASAGSANFNSNTTGTQLTIRDLNVSGTASLIVNSSTGASNILTINRNLNLSAGTLNLSSGNVATTVNLGGNYNQTGGTFTRTITTTITALNFTGAANTYTQSAGTVTNTAINYTIATGAFITLNNGIALSTGRILTVNGGLDVGSQLITGTGGIFTVNAAATLVTNNTDGIMATGVPTGSIQSTGTRTYNVLANYTYNAACTQTGTGLTGANILTINGATLNLSASTVVITQLDMPGALITLGTNNLTLNATGILTNSGSFSSTNMIVADNTGQFFRGIPTSGFNNPYLFPIGTSSGYTPVELNFTSNSVVRNIGVRSVNGTHPSMNVPAAPADYLNRYWPFTVSSAAGTYEYTGKLTYLAGDVVGTETNLVASLWFGSQWSGYITTVDDVNHTLTFPNAGTVNQTNADLNNTQFSGRLTEVLYYYRTRVVTGDWEDPATWEISTDQNFVIPAPVIATQMPTPDNSVGIIIRNGHTVTVNDPVDADQVVIESTGNLVIATGAVFTLLDGPSADLFMNGTGGTVTVNGTFDNRGTFGGTQSAFTVNGTYWHNQNGGVLPVSTWAATSLCQITGLVNTAITAGFTGQNFGNVLYDCAGQTALNLSLGLAGTTTVQGNFTVNSTGTGSAVVKSSTTASALTIAGNLVVNNGTIDLNSNTGLLTFTCNDVDLNNGTVTFNSSTTGTTATVRDFDIAGGTAVINAGTGANTLNINRNLLLSGGTLNLSSGNIATTVNIAGDYNQSGGVFTRTNTGTVTTLNFTGTAGNYIQTAGTITNTAINYAVALGATTTLQNNLLLANSRSFTVNGTLYCGTNIISGGTGTVFTVANANTATLATAHLQGLSTLAGTGSIQTATRTYNGAANYIYNGAASQVTGNGLVTCFNLTINNPTDVSMTGSITSNGTLFLTNGAFGVNTTTLTLNGPAINQTAGSLITTTASNLTFGGATNVNAGLYIPSSVTDLRSLTLNIAGTNQVELRSDITLNIAGAGLVLTSGRLHLNQYNLTLLAATTVSGTPSNTRMVVADGTGYLRKVFAAGGSTFTYPIGDFSGVAPNNTGADYSPVLLTFTANSVQRTIGVRLRDSEHPQNTSNGPQTNYVTRYWSFNDDQAGVGTYTYSVLTFTYSTTANDLNGTAANLRLNRWDNAGSAWYQLLSSTTAPNTTTSGNTYTNATAPLGGSDFALRENPRQIYTWLPTITATYDFNDPANWSPARYSPLITDILHFTSGGTTTAINVPTQTISKLFVDANTNISLRAATTNTLSINGITATQTLQVTSGSTLQIGETSGALTLNFLTTAGQQAAIDGSMVINAGNIFSSAVASSVTVNGSIINNSGTYTATNTTTVVNGAFTLNGGTITSTASNLTFAAGSDYYHAMDAGTIPTATWNAASVANITSPVTGPAAGFNQTFGGLTIATGSAVVSNITGTVTVNGNLTLTDGRLNLNGQQLILNANVTAGGSGFLHSVSNVSHLNIAGTGTGNIGTVAFAPGAQTVGTLTINRATATIGISSPLTVATTLNLTNGFIDNGSNVLTVSSTAVAAIAGGSTGSYVMGPLARNLPASLTGTNTYNFPVGKSEYNLFRLINPTTAASPATQIQVEVVDAPTGGTPGTGLNNLNNRYWQASATTALTGLTGVSLQQSVLGGNAGIGQSATLAGVYQYRGGTISGNTITTSPSYTTSSLGFFAIGERFFTGTVYVGTGQAFTSFTNSGGLFEAISAATLTGNTTVIVTSDLNAESGTYGLNQWTESPANSNYTLSIIPDGTTTRVISGTYNGAQQGLFRFDNVSRVKIDGGTGKYLTFRNSSVANSSLNSTLSLLNDASDIRISNCTFEGASAGTAGVILFGNATTNGGGNDRDSLINCDIRDVAGTGSPAHGIVALGTNVAGQENSEVLISGNNIYNFFNANGTSSGILINSGTALGNDNWNITGNSFYQTFTRTAVSSLNYKVINIDQSGNSNFSINNNYIGGQSANCSGGQWTQNGIANTFTGMALNTGTASPRTSVQNNVIRNISVSTESSSADNAGISVLGGNVNVANNLIGDSTIADGIIYQSSGAGAGFTGILAASPGNVKINNNTVAGVRLPSGGIQIPQTQQTVTSLNSLTGTTTTVLYTGTHTGTNATTADGRDLGKGGLTINITNSNYNNVNANWGMTITPSPAHIYGNTQAISNCNTTGNLTYVNSAANRAAGILQFTGTSNYRAWNGSSYVNVNMNTRYTVTVTTAGGTPIPVAFNNNLLLVPFTQAIKIVMLMETRTPSTLPFVYSGSLSANTWYPAIQLYDQINTDPDYKICTGYNASFYSNGAPVSSGATGLTETTVTALNAITGTTTTVTPSGTGTTLGGSGTAIGATSGGLTYNIVNSNYGAINASWGIQAPTSGFGPYWFAGNVSGAPSGNGPCTMPGNMTYVDNPTNRAAGIAIFTGTSNIRAQTNASGGSYNNVPVNIRLTVKVTTPGNVAIPLVYNNGIISVPFNQALKVNMLMEAATINATNFYCTSGAALCPASTITQGTYYPAIWMYDIMNTDPTYRSCTGVNWSFYINGTTSQVVGVSAANGVDSVMNNSIFNITSDVVSPAAGDSSGVIGVKVTSTLPGQVVEGNTIHSLTATDNTYPVNVVGVYYGGAATGTNVISKNLIHSFSTDAEGAGQAGLQAGGGMAVFKNNMIRLGILANGSAVTSAANIHGILDRSSIVSANFRFYNNTVYIGGDGVSSGATNTYGFRRALTYGTGGNTDELRNNIFVNERNNGSGSGKNYGIHFDRANGISANYNLYYGTGSGYTLAGQTATDYNLAAWKALGYDVNGGEGDPGFKDAVSGTPDLHIDISLPLSPADGNGTLLALVTDDYDGDARNGLRPDIGADEICFITKVLNEPANDTLCAGINAAFAVAVTGSKPYNYQWQVSTDGGSSWSDLTNGGIYSNAVVTNDTSGYDTLKITSAPVTITGNKYRAVVQNSCLSIDTSTEVGIVVDTAAVDLTINTTGPVCVNDTLKLNGATTGGSTVNWNWTGPGNYQSTDQLAIRYPVDEDSGEGMYYLVISNGCGSLQDSVHINIQRPVPVLNTPLFSSNPICEGLNDTITLTYDTTTVSDSDIVWSWTGPDGFASNVQNPILDSIALSAAGDYVIVATNACGMQVQFSPTLQVHQLITANADVPLAAASGLDATVIEVCGGLSVELNGNNPFPGTGTWSQVTGNGTSTYAPDSNTNVVTVSKTGYGLPVTTYRWTIVNGVCRSESDVRVIFDSVMIARAVLAGCSFVSSDSVMIHVSVEGGATAFSFTPPLTDELRVDVNARFKAYTAPTDGLVHNYTISDGFCDTTVSVVTFNNHPIDIPFVNTTGTDTSMCFVRNFSKWITFNDTANKAIIAVNDNNQDLGIMRVAVYRDLLTPVILNNSTTNCFGYQQVAMKRHFVVTSSAPQPFANDVSVRLYFSNDELQDLINASLANDIANDRCSENDNTRDINDLYVTKYTDNAPGNPTEDGDYGNNLAAPAGIYKVYGDTSYFSAGNYQSNVFTAGPLDKYANGFSGLYPGGQGHHYVELNVREFSELWLHGSTSGAALPVEMLYLEANAIDNKYIQVKWATLIELNNAGFSVERSVDGQAWTAIGWVDGHNTTTTQQVYTYDDSTAVPGIRYYYRLRQVDNDGMYEYSGVVSAMLTAETSFGIKDFIPNPAATQTTLIITSNAEQQIEVQVFNVIGQKVMSSRTWLNKGANMIDYDISDLAVGTYTVSVSSAGEVYSKKLVIAR